MDLQQADVQMDPSTGSRSPLHGQQPSLAEYLRYRYPLPPHALLLL